MKNVLAENMHGAFYIAIFSNMMQHQRACDSRIIHHCKQSDAVAFESKMKNA